jgi:hypothetical protein
MLNSSMVATYDEVRLNTCSIELHSRWIQGIGNGFEHCNPLLAAVAEVLTHHAVALFHICR